MMIYNGGAGGGMRGEYFLLLYVEGNEEGMKNDGMRQTSLPYVRV